MAVGDDASSAGYPLVPDTGEEGRVRWGAREINRTRDMIAQVKTTVPQSTDAFRAGAKITVSGSMPSNNQGANGDIWFRTL